LGDIQLLRNPFLTDLMQCFLAHTTVGIAYQYCLQARGQCRQVVTAVTGEYGISFMEALLCHEEADGMILGSALG